MENWWNNIDLNWQKALLKNLHMVRQLHKPEDLTRENWLLNPDERKLGSMYASLLGSAYKHKAPSVADIKEIENLDQVFLGALKLVDISPVSQLSKLQKASFCLNKKLSDISPLAANPELEYLQLLNTNISDIKVLSNHKKMTALYMPLCPVSDISSLSALALLKELSLYGTKINSIDALSKLSNLKDITVSKTKIDNLDAVANLTALESISAYSTKISDLKSLEKLTQLKSLEAGWTKVNNIEVLFNLPNLETIQISEKVPANQVEEFKKVNPNCEVLLV